MDTWNTRDLPVLKAAVDIYEESGRQAITPEEIAGVLDIDVETVQKALRKLNAGPYFGEMQAGWGGEIFMIGPPTAEAFRVAGHWPTPEGMVEQLIAALDRASGESDRDAEERTKLQQTALWLRGTLYTIAVGALGGAGGNAING